MKTATKILFLPILFLLIYSSPLKAQLLNNTRWKVYDNGSHAFVQFWNFQNDTIAESIDNINWNWFATYTEVGNVFSIHDIENVTCINSETGVYNFSILFDTLRFTKITDGCQSRSEFMTTHFFVDLPIGVNELEVHNNVSVFPAPFSSELNISTHGGLFYFTLYDISGRKIMMKSFDGVATFETEFLESGMYLYELRLQDRIVKTGTAIKF
jgi:hypothetical protein